MLMRILTEHLTAVGFHVRPPVGSGAAHDPTRFYNTPPAGGVQMELTRSLRQQMIDGSLPGDDNRALDCESLVPNDCFRALVHAVRSALECYLAEVRANLDLTMKRFEEATDRFPSSLRQRAHHHPGRDEV